MALNLHKNLPDDEIHVPKGFGTATASSVSSKNLTNELEWIGSNYSVTTVITCLADVSGITGGRYFLLPTKSVTYQVWFDVDDTDSIVINTGYTGVEIDISADDTATTIATALKVGLHALTGITASAASEKVTVVIESAHVSSLSAQDGIVGSNTGYKFVNSKTHVGDEYLTTDGSGNIQWEAQPAAATEYPFIYHHFGGLCRPKSLVTRYAAGNSGGDTADTFSVDIGPTITSGVSTIAANLIPQVCGYIATTNLAFRNIFYTISHNHATTHPDIEMHLFKVVPAAGTSAKVIYWVGGISAAVGTPVSIVDDEVTSGNFTITSVSADKLLTAGDQLFVTIKSDVDVEIYYSIGVDLKMI